MKKIEQGAKPWHGITIFYNDSIITKKSIGNAETFRYYIFLQENMDLKFDIRF